jgi:hypothetical protein
MRCHPHARLALAPAAAVLLSVGVGACGGAGGGAAGSSGSAPHAVTAAAVAKLPLPERQPDSEYDSDSYQGEPDNDNNHVFGHPAAAAEVSEITALVKRYYAAAAASDGAAGCSLLYSTFAEGVAEDYGQLAGLSQAQGATCAEVMSKLFERRHRQLSADNATLKVVAVRVLGKRGSVMLDFGGTHGRYLEVHGELGRWKVDSLFDSSAAIFVE